MHGRFVNEPRMRAAQTRDARRGLRAGAGRAHVVAFRALCLAAVAVLLHDVRVKTLHAQCVICRDCTRLAVLKPVFRCNGIKPACPTKNHSTVPITRAHSARKAPSIIYYRELLVICGLARRWADGAWDFPVENQCFGIRLAKRPNSKSSTSWRFAGHPDSTLGRTCGTTSRPGSRRSCGCCCCRARRPSCPTAALQQVKPDRGSKQ